MKTPPDSERHPLSVRYALLLQRAERPDLILQDEVAGMDETWLWTHVVLQAVVGARVLPADFDLTQALCRVEASLERQQSLALSSRLGVISASEVLALIEQWKEEDGD